MKGVIIICLKELVVKNGGKTLWSYIMNNCNLNENTPIYANENIEDEVALKLIVESAKVFNLTIAEFADVYGIYWVNDYAARIYKAYFIGIYDAKSFLLNMNEVHKLVVKKNPDSKPPNFTFEWKSENVLLINYLSDRGLIDIAVGLVKGVGKYFNETLKVKKLNNSFIEVIFQ
jgi:hypothetical protein